MMELEITHTFGQIGVRSQRAYLKLSQGLASLDISQKITQVEVEAPLGELKIDSTVHLEDIGIYSSLAMGPRYYQKSWDHGYEAIGEMAADGDFLAMIERGHTIIDSVERKTAPPLKEAHIGFKRGAEIEYTFRGVRLYPKQGGMTLHSRPFYPEKTYHPGDVSVYLIQKGKVDIDVRGRRMDTAV